MYAAFIAYNSGIRRTAVIESGVFSNGNSLAAVERYDAHVGQCLRCRTSHRRRSHRR